MIIKRKINSKKICVFLVSIFFVFVIVKLDAEKRTHEKILQKFVELIQKTNNKKKALPKQQPKQDNILILKDLGKTSSVASSSTNYSRKTQKNFALNGYQKRKIDEKSDSLWRTKRRHFYNWNNRKQGTIEFSSLKDAKNFTLRFLLKKSKHEFYTGTNAVKLEPLQQFSQVQLDPANNELEQLAIQTERAGQVDEIIDDESEQILQPISVERVEDEQEQSVQYISVERHDAVVEEPEQALPIIPIIPMNEQFIEELVEAPIEDEAVQINLVERVGDDQEQPLQHILNANSVPEATKTNDEQHGEIHSSIVATNVYRSIMEDLPLLEDPNLSSNEEELFSLYPTTLVVGDAYDSDLQKNDSFQTSNTTNMNRSTSDEEKFLPVPVVGNVPQTQPTDDSNLQIMGRIQTSNNSTGSTRSDKHKKRKCFCGCCSIQ